MEDMERIENKISWAGTFGITALLLVLWWR